MKPVVAHMNYSFFIKSETFVYRYVSSHQDFEAVLLAGRFENLDQFPFPENRRHVVSRRKGSLDWMLYGGLKKLTSRDIPVERILKSNGAKMIHAHFGPTGYDALRFKRALGIPIVTSFYGYDLSVLAKDALWRKRYAELFREGDLFLVEGRNMRDKLLLLGCPEEKAAIQRIAIPISKIQYKERRPRARGEKTRLVFTGRFVEKKGLLFAIQALENVHQRNPNFEFHIIGDGPLKGQFEKLIETYRLGHCIRLLGFLNYDAYLEEMNRADLFVHPSVTASNGDSEGGAPTTILEAQAMGLPIIATNHADIPNVVVPGESALLSEERSVPELARNIEMLLEYQERWADMGRAGRRFVEQFHDIRTEIHELENKYKKVLGYKTETGESDLVPKDFHGAAKYEAMLREEDDSFIHNF